MSIGLFHPYCIIKWRTRDTSPNTRCRQRMQYGLLFASLSLSGMTQAAGLDTKLPSTASSSESNTFISTHDVNLPEAPLAASLQRYETLSQTHIKFDSALVVGKTAPAVKGRLTVKETLNRLLVGSDLVADMQGGNVMLKPSPKSKNDGPNITLETTQVRAQRFYEVGPLPGLGLTKEEIPGNVQSISAEQIKRAHALSIADLMNTQLQSVNVNDYQGNPFQMDVQYRGFTASPQIGTPQGLSVFFDGIRVNEPFGDVVNWDMIPMNAISGLDVFPGSNPIFGLNTLGGALTVKTKDGFKNQGVDAEVLTGSFGRKQLQVSGGWNNGTVGLFGAGNFFLEDGWRDNSPSKVNQAFGKANYRGDKLDLGLSTLIVSNDLVGNGLVPSQMYQQNNSSVYSSPDTTKNRLLQFQLSGDYFVNDSFNITGQVYRRNSKRHSKGADVFTDISDIYARRVPQKTEQYTCLLNSSQGNGFPDYYVLPVVVNDVNEAGSKFFSEAFVQDYINNGKPNFSLLPADAFNKALPQEVVDYLKSAIAYDSNYYKTSLERTKAPVNNAGPATSYSFGETSYFFDTFSGNEGYSLIPANSVDPFAGIANFYYQKTGNVITKNYVMFVGPSNQANCRTTHQTGVGTESAPNAYTYADPVTNKTVLIDGADYGGKGVVEGTPTAIINDNNIDQMVDGASVQFNWNLEHHKFMVGASIDAARATYENSQLFGLLDAQRNAYLAPDLINPIFAAKDIPLINNNFSGTNVTKSLYASETWTPVPSFHLTGAARYNVTHTRTTIASRHGDFVFGIGEFLNYPDSFTVCNQGQCPTNLQYTNPIANDTLDPAETEKFSYYSLNPSLGATWQAQENLNVYANVAQGTRTPSVIELGCALDKTLSNVGTVQNPRYIYKSVEENRQCSLPTTLSGDPYLPQIKATSYDVGMRGRWGQDMEWNLGAYETDLQDDIYFVTVQDGRGFFDSIGKTRRRGIEAGVSGKYGKAKFKVNYALTDATFQDSFIMASNDNSSAFHSDLYGNGVIQVNPGNRMPGVPLHNLNATLNYDVTEKWQVGVTAVVHSDSFVRGNENNQHQTGIARTQEITTYTNVNGTPVATPLTVKRQPTSNPGSVAGYAVFNFNTRYQLSPEWSLGLQVNNIFDKQYFSAGRLGRNPFSPQINGAIGPDGYNHNSSDWLSANFLAPGAPRAAWLSLTYEFAPDRR